MMLVSSFWELHSQPPLAALPLHPRHPFSPHPVTEFLKPEPLHTTHLEGVYNKVVVGGEHVEGVMTGIESRLTGGPGERQLSDVLQYPRLFVWRRLRDDVVQCQCALVRVRVVHVTFRVREVATGLQSNRSGLHRVF